ncbi:hypothetical protein HYE60_01285 [Aggregatibacter actinomycetemcomitans]|uniref:hypothetical protein n=1 Tax=Aggregatibacter actinomycetemcomitans TaxID=714 RepID=UPI00197C6632|nr:hypothetical protein [Aggregatibacter actinomycetemcomitans]MBN6073910.1 hypothetical protein [Aggregatibacter actinomycetemcomitans]
MRKLKTQVARSKKYLNPFEEERLPDSAQLADAIRKAELFLAFAKDYIHNRHLKGATDAMKSVKRATTAGLKITGVK